MDGQLSVFHCSDISLRRHLAIKLSACQLSVPFLLPHPAAPSRNVTMLLSALESVTKSWKGASNNNKSAQEVFATGFFHSHWQKHHVEIIPDKQSDE